MANYRIEYIRRNGAKSHAEVSAKSLEQAIAKVESFTFVADVTGGKIVSK